MKKMSAKCYYPGIHNIIILHTSSTEYLLISGHATAFVDKFVCM